MTQTKAGPRPRAHNVSSYFVTLVVFLVVTATRSLWARGSSGAALLPALLFTFHFLRRTVESAALHRYAKPAVPLVDALQEYAYYWAFAFWIGWSITREGYATSTDLVLGAGLVMFAIGEVGNLGTHAMLARLRPKGTSVRVVPRGFLFELVSCPNYLFEIVTWAGFAIVARVTAAYVFLVLGAAILTDWARKRHAAYRLEFADYPAQRKRLVPFVY